MKRFYRRGIPFIWLLGRCPSCKKGTWFTVGLNNYQEDSNYSGKEVRCRKCEKVFDL